MTTLHVIIYIATKQAGTTVFIAIIITTKLNKNTNMLDIE